MGRAVETQLGGDPAAVAPRTREIVAELRRRLEAIYGDRLVAMVLYGSQARGDAELGSDIDVMVVLEGPVDPWQEIERTLDDVADLSLERGCVASCLFMEAGRYELEQGPLLINVRREGVLV